MYPAKKTLEGDKFTCRLDSTLIFVKRRSRACFLEFLHSFQISFKMPTIIRKLLDDPAQVMISKLRYKCSNETLEVGDLIVAKVTIGGNESECPASILDTREAGMSWLIYVAYLSFPFS